MKGEITMANREPGFYWIVPVLDVDCDEEDFEWMNNVQPAYWDGTRWVAQPSSSQDLLPFPDPKLDQ